MRRQLPVAMAVAVILAIGSASALAHAGDERSVRRQLEVHYARIVKGFRKNDPSVWEKLLDPDFKLKLFNGSVQDRTWVVDYVRNNAKTFKVLKLSMTIKDLVLAGNDATAVVEQKSSRAFNDEQGQSHKLDVGVLQRETWTKTPSGWRLKHVEEWKVLYLLKDGKPVTQ